MRGNHADSVDLLNVLGKVTDIKFIVRPRKCKKKECKKILSKYNINEYCFVHQREVPADGEFKFPRRGKR